MSADIYQVLESILTRVLSQQQIDQFWEQGFISPIDVLSAFEASTYLHKLEAAEHEYSEQINPQSRNNLHLCFDFFDELVHHPVVLDAVEDLIGPDISLWGSVLFAKNPHSSQFVSWHQDATYMGIVPHEFVTPWLALTPSNRNNGCMSMIPGSHRQHIRRHLDSFDENNILTRGQAVEDVDASKAVDLILQPGQMSLHHAEIIHGSQPNGSSQRRIGFAMQAFMAPPAKQVIGKNYWLPVRGRHWHRSQELLSRPVSTMHPEAVDQRQRVNENWAQILYSGATQKRDY